VIVNQTSQGFRSHRRYDAGRGKLSQENLGTGDNTGGALCLVGRFGLVKDGIRSFSTAAFGQGAIINKPPF
jgi:hypothetical protein